MITAVVEWVPQSFKIALRGQHGSPKPLANAIHSILNRLPAERYPILPCAGVLQGFRMRVDWQIHRSFVYGTWEPEVVQAIQQEVTPGMNVLDLGAQSGFYTLLLSRLVGPEGQVFAFEPLPANFRLLDENVRLNRLRNVVVSHEAVAQASGELSFQFPHHEKSLVAGPLHEDDNLGTLTVQGISIDDFALQAKVPIHFVKMDIEGAEWAALQGAESVLKEFHPGLMIELHDRVSQNAENPVVAHLLELGYEIEWLGDVSITAHIIARWPRKAGASERR
jgi:FkbM family methyltransferase